MMKIMIVDDEKIQRLTISHTLKKRLSNYISTIEEAIDGNDAIQKLIKNKDINIILMDITMPNCDGIEATKMIRLFNKKVKIYAVTAANITSELKIKCRTAGMDNFLNKPFNIELFLKLFKEGDYQKKDDTK